MTDPTAAMVENLITPSSANVEAFLDEMREWPGGFISATAFAVAAANWPQVRELALAEWRICLDDPDSEVLGSQLPVLGFYLAAANHDAAFLAPMLEGWRKDDETRDILFGDILLADGAALWARMAEKSPGAIRLLEEAVPSGLRTDPHEANVPLEALALLMQHGVYERSSFDSLMRRYIDAHDALEADDRKERLKWLSVVLADSGPGIFRDEARSWLSNPEPKPKRGRDIFDLEIIDLLTFDEIASQDLSEKAWHAWRRFDEIPKDSWVAMEWMGRAPDQEEEDLDDDSFLPGDSSYDDDGPVQPIVRIEPKIGRNDPCPCGSGKKFKKCCGKSGSAA